ncbi:MAG TPA: hypothetical protein PLW64_03210 [Niabella sp.]|nr:hypothetical protein [Niabella sp.]
MSASANNTLPQRKYNFKIQWLLKLGNTEGASDPAFDDKNWKVVTLPAAWYEEEAFKKDITD